MGILAPYLRTRHPHEMRMLSMGRRITLVVSWAAVRVGRFSGRSLATGVEDHAVESVRVTVYNAVRRLLKNGGSAHRLKPVPPKNRALDRAW